jgi:hypothetical protein
MQQKPPPTRVFSARFWLHAMQIIWIHAHQSERFLTQPPPNLAPWATETPCKGLNIQKYILNIGEGVEVHKRPRSRNSTISIKSLNNVVFLNKLWSLPDNTALDEGSLYKTINLSLFLYEFQYEIA